MTTTALSQLAYERIQAMFLNQRFSPGMKISETKLARELGISRTPVREAIRQLQNEGLLHQVAHSGTYVSRPDRRQIAEMYEVRLALETLAVAKGIPRLRHEDLDRLAGLYRTMHEHVTRFRNGGQPTLEGEPLRQFLSADMAFHLVLFEAADNRTAMKIYTDVQMRCRFFGMHSHRRDLEHLTSVLRSHSSILSDAQRQDAESARLHMIEHIENSLRDALRTFDETPDPPPVCEDEAVNPVQSLNTQDAEDSA
jgi:DNA-binding GntR family transcriptional regulator